MITVSQLVAILNDMNQDAIVLVGDHEDPKDTSPLEVVKYGAAIEFWLSGTHQMEREIIDKGHVVVLYPR